MSENPDDGKTARQDTEAILSRRRFLIQSALAGAGVVATSCKRKATRSAEKGVEPPLKPGPDSGPKAVPCLSKPAPMRREPSDPGGLNPMEPPAPLRPEPMDTMRPGPRRRRRRRGMKRPHRPMPCLQPLWDRDKRRKDKELEKLLRGK